MEFICHFGRHQFAMLTRFVLLSLPWFFEILSSCWKLQLNGRRWPVGLHSFLLRDDRRKLLERNCDFGEPYAGNFTQCLVNRMTVCFSLRFFYSFIVFRIPLFSYLPAIELNSTDGIPHHFYSNGNDSVLAGKKQTIKFAGFNPLFIICHWKKNSSAET